MGERRVKVAEADWVDKDHAHRPETLRITTETIVDNWSVERRLFHLSETTSLIFLGREELPDIAPCLAGQGPVRLLTPEERPVFAGPDSYQNWSSGLEAPKDPAKPKCLVAKATPLGLVDAALALAERGFGHGSVGRLDQLRAKLRDRVVDDEVKNLYDLAFAATSIQAENDSHEQGLLEMALYLAGDEKASATVADKQQQRQQCDQQNWEQIYNGEPGRQPSAAELHWLKQQHLIVVHTTRSQPDGRLLPTAAYNQDSPDHAPRVTIHTSLNHPVKSHLFGNFENQPHTVVSPLVDMVAENGLPDSINSVDTYFTVDANEGLKLPAETIVISQDSDQKQLVTINQRTVRLRPGPISRADLDSLMAASEAFDPPPANRTQQEAGWNHNCQKEAIADWIGEQIGVSFYSDFQTINQGLAVSNNPHGRQLSQTELGLFNQLTPEDEETQNKPSSNYRGLGRQLMDQYLALDYNHKCLDCPNLTAVCQEAIRTMCVSWSIKYLGGRVIRAGQHYSFDKTVEQSVADITHQLGVKNRSHNDTDDHYFERQALDNNRHWLESDRQGKEGEAGDTAEAAYYAQMQQVEQRQGAEELWGLLEGLRPEHRRAAISGNYLLYTKPPGPPEMPESLQGPLMI